LAKKKKAKKKKARRPPGRPPGPVVLAINICDSVILDELTKKVSLVGLFNLIRSFNFPCTHPLMHIYIAMTGGHGRHKVDVRLVRTRDQQPVMGSVGPVEFSNPLQVVEMNIRWNNVGFAEPGGYSVDVLCDDGHVPIGSRKFYVIKQGEIKPTSGSEGT
jgi:hypothetical protein